MNRLFTTFLIFLLTVLLFSCGSAGARGLGYICHCPDGPHGKVYREQCGPTGACMTGELMRCESECKAPNYRYKSKGCICKRFDYPTCEVELANIDSAENEQFFTRNELMEALSAYEKAIRKYNELQEILWRDCFRQTIGDWKDGKAANCIAGGIESRLAKRDMDKAKQRVEKAEDRIAEAEKLIPYTDQMYETCIYQEEKAASEALNR